MANNIETNPRLALKGLALSFKEMAELGIDTTEEVRAYLTDKFGPDVAEMYGNLAAAGIDSFEEVEAANADQVAAIFSNLKPLQMEFEEIFGGAGDGIANGIDKGVKRAMNSVDDLVEYSRKAGKEINKNLVIRPSDGVDKNRPLVERAR